MAKRNATKWTAMIADWQSSGQSCQAYCRSHHVVYHQFMYWRHKLASASDVKSVPSPPKLVPVSVTSSTPNRPVEPRDLELVLPNGCIIRGVTQENVHTVGDVLRLL